MVTNSHATLIQPNECYIYPMANSLRGGAIASEYNIRNLFGVLLSKSSAKTNNDFEANVDESSKWYGKELNINTSQNGQRKEYTSDFELIISPGSGNCNGYYIETNNDIKFKFYKRFVINNTNLTSTNLNNNYLFDVYIYLRIIYSGTGICDGAYLWAGDKEEVNSELEKFKKYGFYDIGIELGHIEVNITPNNTDEPLSAKYFENDNKMACIDLDRLGNANGTFADQLYNRLSRLYRLMIDIGTITVGTVINDSYDPQPGTNSHDFSLISPYKIQMYIDEERDDTNKFTGNYSGGLRYIKFSTEQGHYEEVDSNSKTELSINLLTFTTDSSGRNIKSISLLNNNVFTNNSLTTENIKSTNANIINIKSTSANIKSIESERLNLKYGSNYVRIEASTDKDNLPQLTIMSNNSDNNVTFRCNHINADIITGTKVYGAVWQ